MELHGINASMASRHVKQFMIWRPSAAYRPAPVAPPPSSAQRCFSEFLIVLLLICLVAPSGCNRADSRRNRIWGEVTLDGKRIDNGFIDFEPIEGSRGPQSSGTITDGRYDIPKKQGPFGGLHRVEITAYHFTGRQVRNMGGDLIDYEENFIPEKYFGIDSVLRVEIDPGGKNEHDFAIEP